MEAEARGTWPQSPGKPGAPRSWEKQKGPSPLRGNQPCPPLYFRLWPPERERTIYCFKPPSEWFFVSAAPGHSPGVQGWESDQHEPVEGGL